MDSENLTVYLTIFSLLSTLVAVATSVLSILSINSVSSWKVPHVALSVVTTLFDVTLLFITVSRALRSKIREPDMNMVSSMEKGFDRQHLTIQIPDDQHRPAPVFYSAVVTRSLYFFITIWAASAAFSIYKIVNGYDDSTPKITLVLASLCWSETLFLLITIVLSILGRKLYVAAHGPSRKPERRAQKHEDHWTSYSWSETPVTANIPSAGLIRKPSAVGRIARKYTLKGSKAALKDFPRSVKLSDASAPMIGRQHGSPEPSGVMSTPPPKRPAIAVVHESARM